MNLHLTWLKYCSKLLEVSKQSVEDRKKAFVPRPSDTDNTQLESFKNVALITDDNLPQRFQKNHKSYCPDDKVTNYSDARTVFLVGRQSALHLINDGISKENNFETEVELSDLYKMLAFYEGLKYMKQDTYTRMSKMHKRRITLMKTTIAKNIGNLGWKNIFYERFTARNKVSKRNVSHFDVSILKICN